jgi:hypothetical protein
VLEGPRGAGGAVLYQTVTLRIEGGFEPRRVRRHQVWEVGTVPVPDLYYRPEYDEGRRQYHQEARMPATRAVVEEPELRAVRGGGGGWGAVLGWGRGLKRPVFRAARRSRRSSRRS